MNFVRNTTHQVLQYPIRALDSTNGHIGGLSRRIAQYVDSTAREDKNIVLKVPMYLTDLAVWLAAGVPQFILGTARSALNFVARVIQPADVDSRIPPLPVSDDEAEVPAPAAPAVEEEEAEVPAPAAPAVEEEEAEVPAPAAPAVEEEEAEVPAPAAPAVEEEEAEVPAPAAPAVEEEEAEVPAPAAPAVEEEEAEVPAPAAPVVEEEEAEVPAPAAPAVEEEEVEDLSTSVYGSSEEDLAAAAEQQGAFGDLNDAVYYAALNVDGIASRLNRANAKEKGHVGTL